VPMKLEIIPINLPLPLNISDVHAYLLKKDNGFFLIDTELTNCRRKLERELESHGCSSGKLKLILLTHGDFDHIANAVYLRRRFGVKVAMHYADAGMLENGDMFWNRKFDNRLVKGLMRLLLH
jgi:hydroxyacylglutathione hydrolase